MTEVRVIGEPGATKDECSGRSTFVLSARILPRGTVHARLSHRNGTSHVNMQLAGCCGSLRGGVALNISARCRTFQERRCATQHHHRPQSPVQCSPLRASPLTPRSGDGMVPGTGRTIDPSHPTGGTSARAVDLRADRFFSAFPRVPLSPPRLFTDAFTCRFKGAVVSTRARCACALGVPGLTLAARPLTGDLGARGSRAPVSLD
jgi:hypothetical protein